MLNQMAQRTARRPGDLHRQEGGAVILLVLAGFLVLILVSLAMHDAGEAAHEEIQVQNAADTAAYSQSVVKARSMNMIAYANTAKRMFFGQMVVYNTGMAALYASTASYCSSCSIVNPYACYRCVIGGLQIVGELINYFTNVMDAVERASDEIKNLDALQSYLAGVSPWWGFTEALMRGTHNGATLTTTWPPPAAELTSTMNDVRSWIQAIDAIFDTNIYSQVPGNPTGAFDRLPATQRGGLNLEDNVMDFLGYPGFSGSVGTQDYLDYCMEFFATPEHAIPFIKHWTQSDGGGWDPAGISADSQTRGYFAAFNLGASGFCWQLLQFPWMSFPPMIGWFFDANEELMDYRLDGGGLFPGDVNKNGWMQSTSNITLAYRASQRATAAEFDAPNMGNFSGSGDFGPGARYEFDNLDLPEHAENPEFQASGTFSLARSELVWRDHPDALRSIGDVLGAGNVFSQIGQAVMEGPLVFSRGTPHMWTPRWTARLRPVYLPGESLGSELGADLPGVAGTIFDMLYDVPTEGAGLHHILSDSAPYLMVAGAVVGAMDQIFGTSGGDFDFATAATDFYYLMASATTFDADRLEGIEK